MLRAVNSKMGGAAPLKIMIAGFAGGHLVERPRRFPVRGKLSGKN
jgi:hypothetical protein